MVALEYGGGLCVLLIRGARATYPRTFHVGFDVEPEANVDAVHRRLVGEGLEVAAPRRAPCGSYTFHFTIPGGDFEFEVACAANEVRDAAEGAGFDIGGRPSCRAAVA